MKTIITTFLALTLSYNLAHAREKLTSCSDSTGHVQVQLNGDQKVTLLGGTLANGASTTTFESEHTNLKNFCYQFSISAYDPSEDEFIIDFEMKQQCRRKQSEAYLYHVNPETGSIQKRLFCRAGLI